MIQVGGELDAWTAPALCGRVQDLIEAGFVGIYIAVLPADRIVTDLDLFARGLVFGNPLIDQIRARGKVPPEVTHAQLIERLEREFGTGPTVVPLQTISYSARKPA